MGLRDSISSSRKGSADVSGERKKSVGVETRQGIGLGYAAAPGGMTGEGMNTTKPAYEKEIRRSIAEASGDTFVTSKLGVGKTLVGGHGETRAGIGEGYSAPEGGMTGEGMNTTDMKYERKMRSSIAEASGDTYESKMGIGKTRKGSTGETREGLGEGYTAPPGGMTGEGMNTTDKKYEKHMREEIANEEAGNAASHPA